MNYGDRITIEAGKCGGKPCIRGMRITVYDVLDYVASGMTHEEILADFPDLTEEDLRACLAFAADRERRLFAVGETREEALVLIREAIEFHLEGMREDGLDTPSPASCIELVHVDA